MPHVKKNFMEAWLRLIGMKLYQRRATDYFRNASADDRRYLLYNPTSKMKVTLQSEEVIACLWDVIAAKGFERDTYFSSLSPATSRPVKARGNRPCERPTSFRKIYQRFFFNPKDYALWHRIST